MSDDTVNEYLVIIRLAIKELQDQLQGLEEGLKDLRESFMAHDHPYKPEPRYGGIL